MKKRMKMLALLLATAVTVTSVPYQNVVLAATGEVEETNEFASYEAAVASFAVGTEAVTKEEPTSVAGVFWNNGADEESKAYTYSEDLRTKKQINVFKGNSVLSSDKLSVSTEELSYDNATLLEKLGYDSESYEIGNVDYVYQWYSISQDGTKQQESTDSSVDPSFTNSDVKKTYLCQVSISSIEVENEDAEIVNIAESDLNDKGIATVANKIFSFEYVEDESSKVLLAYNTSDMSDADKEKLTKNDTVYTQEYEYAESSTSVTMYADDNLSMQEYNLRRAFEIPAEADVSYETEYTWYIEDAEGNRTWAWEGGNNYWTQVYAKDGNATYVCVQTLKSVTYYDSDEQDDKTIELNATTMPAGYSNTVEKVFEFKYTGLTKEDFENGSEKLSDYFNGIDSLEDKTVKIESFNGTEYYDITDLSGYNSSTSMQQTWTAYFTDGTKKVCSTSECSYGYYYPIKVYEDIYETEDSEDTTRKYVDHYVYQVDFMYNDMVIDTISKNVKVNYEPFTLHNEGNQTVSVRKNGKYTFSVSAEINDEEYCQGFNYQWYSVDKDGKETLLEGETDITLKQKITDSSVAYKCKVTGIMTEDYTGPEIVKEASFSIATSSGYRLIDRTSSDVSKK